MYYLLNTNNYMAVHHLMLGERNSSNAEDVHSNDIVRRTLYILANSSLLEFVRTNIPNSWIRDYHNHKAIFPSAKGVFLDAEVRDSVLASTNNVEIRGEHIIPDTMLLYGSDINFTFNDYNFQWYRNDNLYLMEKERYWEISSSAFWITPIVQMAYTPRLERMIRGWGSASEMHPMPAEPIIAGSRTGPGTPPASSRTCGTGDR